MTAIIVRARTSDPETSHQAALQFEQPRAQRSVACVVLILKEHGPSSDFTIRFLWDRYWGSKAWSFTHAHEDQRLAPTGRGIPGH